MKTKLTITVDSDVARAARRHAHARGISLSSLIEASLQEIVEDEDSSFSERWRGQFRAASREDRRYRALSRKHL